MRTTVATERRGAHVVDRSHWTAPDRLLRMVDRDAAEDGFATTWSRALAWFPLAGTVVLGIVYVAARPWFYWLLRDDHVVEWGQFTCCFFASVMSVPAAVRLVRTGHGRLGALLALVALGALVLAGEEISWGQRVFGLTGADALVSNNRQGELNLHNFQQGAGVSADLISELGQLAVGLAALAVSLLARPAGSLLKARGWWRVAPPLFTLPGFALIALYRVFKLVTRTSASPVIVYQEWAEFCFYLAIAVTVGFCYARARAGRYQAVPGGRPTVQRANPDAPPGARVLIGVGAVAVLVTVLLAALAARTGILPGNVPGAGRRQSAHGVVTSS